MALSMLEGAQAAPTLEDAIRVVGSARATAAEVALLTGTEDFDIDAFREKLRTDRGAVPYEGLDTAAGVVQLANRGSTTVEQLVTFNVAWSALEVNWVFATLLGDAESASQLLQQSNLLINYEAQYMANVQQGAAFVSFYAQNEANQFVLTLRRTASDMNLIALIPDAVDPEGFIRQRLQVGYNRLTNAADFIHSAGEAFAIFY